MRIKPAVELRTVPERCALRNNSEFMRMIHDPSLTQVSIAKKFGVSRERVRQIAAEHGINGTDNLLERKFRHREQLHDRIPFVRAAKDRGLKVEVLTKRLLLVNGARTFLGRCCWHKIPGNRNRVINFRRSTADVEVFVYILPDSLGYLIIPEQAAPPWGKATGFIPFEPQTNLKGAHCKRHDWRTYINAWHILGGKSETA